MVVHAGRDWGGVVDPVRPTSLPHGAAKRLILWGSLYPV